MGDDGDISETILGKHGDLYWRAATEKCKKTPRQNAATRF